MERLDGLKGKEGPGVGLLQEETKGAALLKRLVEKFEAAMEDDFNTADAVSALFEMVKLANTTATESSSKAYISRLTQEIKNLSNVLGIITERKTQDLDQEVEELIEKRRQARMAKDFALADEIRGRLLAMGIVLEDTREGVKWKRV